MYKSKIVKCGNIGCILDICVHKKEHKQDTDCCNTCVVSDGQYRCYTIAEMRKIKLEKLGNLD